MAEGGSAPPGLATQGNEIMELIKQPLQKGEVRYLLDNRWFRQWKKYVGCDNYDNAAIGEQSAHPGPMDNSPLLKGDGSSELREHLLDDLDFVLLPVEAWEKLVSWYGVMAGQDPIVRNVVENGLYVKMCQVEIYLIELKLCMLNDLDAFLPKKFSKTDTIEFVEQEMRKLFNIPDDKETRLWNRYTSYTYEPISKKNCTVQDASLFHGQVVVIEQKNDDGTWPRQMKTANNAIGIGNTSTGGSDNKQYGGSNNVMSTRMGGFGSYNYNYNDSGIGDVRPGLCGLTNLGNTCFMNSALQCMSNTPPLTDYFLKDRYWDELNTENPLGMKGEIAKAHAELIKYMWSGKATCTAPRNFKMQVGRFAPQFSGYQQQDSQELMAFLLDGLHEDLNRIKKKPYIELRDADGRDDVVVAKESWENYRKRNDSIVIDLFHGLLKSTLVCPDCCKVSVTFDPFCYLTLPLPVKKERQIEVVFVSLDLTSTPMQYKLTVPKAGSIDDLCNGLSRFTNVPASRMVVTDVYDHKFHKIFHPKDGLSSIMERDTIVIYEVPVTSVDDPDTIILPVYMRQKRVWSGCHNDNRSSFNLFGHPLLVAAPRKSCTYKALYEIILTQMSRYVRIPSSDDAWWVQKEKNTNSGEVEMSNGDEDEEIDSQPEEYSKDEDEGIDSQEESNDHNTDDLKYMFTMHFVNSSGSTDVEHLKDDGRYIKFQHHSYLAIDWHPTARELFYDEKLADAQDVHETASSSRYIQKRQVIQLSECLELFTATERLSAEDSWYCPCCKKHQQATKKFDLWSLPQVLVLCFKRFSYNRYMRDKIDTLVEFPTSDLDMSKYIIGKDHRSAVYDLIAVSNHYGGMGGGHYTAYAKNKDDQHWYYFDDSSVSPAKEETVVSKAAYVLFYILRDHSFTPSIAKEIPAACGTPDTQDNGISTSSDEDCSMDIN